MQSLDWSKKGILRVGAWNSRERCGNSEIWIIGGLIPNTESVNPNPNTWYKDCFWGVIIFVFHWQTTSKPAWYWTLFYFIFLLTFVWLPRKPRKMEKSKEIIPLWVLSDLSLFCLLAHREFDWGRAMDLGTVKSTYDNAFFNSYKNMLWPVGTSRIMNTRWFVTYDT